MMNKVLTSYKFYVQEDFYQVSWNDLPPGCLGELMNLDGLWYILQRPQQAPVLVSELV